eukprot:scaffold5297_cov110-Isochrysis_galbana.AAC.2
MPIPRSESKKTTRLASSSNHWRVENKPLYDKIGLSRVVGLSPDTGRRFYNPDPGTCLGVWRMRRSFSRSAQG